MNATRILDLRSDDADRLPIAGSQRGDLHGRGSEAAHVPTFQLSNDAYGHRLDPDFKHVERIEISWIKFWTNEPGEVCGGFKFWGDEPSLGEKESRVTDQPKRKTNMKQFVMKLARATRAQDLIEYALVAGFIAVASGAVMPGVASSLSTIFSKVNSVVAIASTQGN